ncbi:MAG: Arginine/ornithine antiporter ArcD [Edaphobacter sp.]|jgi:hypothetical protein|nr:Arginine/ornithine antiporter ArcD [Edaphobacter sp.]
MQAATQVVPVSKKTLLTGRILSGLAVLFLLMDGAMKLVHPLPAPVVEAQAQLGLPESLTFGIGILLLACTILYAIPRTSVFGAILLTGYLGGAIALQLRVGNPLFSHVLFPVYIALLIWGGLFLRENRLRELVPLLG